jgi:hypothetical protein
MLFRPMLHRVTAFDPDAPPHELPCGHLGLRSLQYSLPTGDTIHNTLPPGNHMSQADLLVLYKCADSVLRGPETVPFPKDCLLSAYSRVGPGKPPEWGEEVQGAAELLRTASVPWKGEFAQLVIMVATPSSIQGTVPWLIVPDLLELPTEVSSASLQVAYKKINQTMMHSFRGQPVIGNLLSSLFQDACGESPSHCISPAIAFIRYLAKSVMYSVPDEIRQKILAKVAVVTGKEPSGKKALASSPQAGAAGAAAATDDPSGGAAMGRSAALVHDSSDDEFLKCGAYYPGLPLLRERGTYHKDKRGPRNSKLDCCDKTFSRSSATTGDGCLVVPHTVAFLYVCQRQVSDSSCPPPPQGVSSS